ncbi:MAG: thymidylate kinase [Candidatus Thermoplasmatota archaeon]
MRLIIVDGLDGVGKDTHAALIKKRYEARGEQVIIRSHPESDNFFGRSAKKALLGSGKINRLKASVFYAFDVLRSLRLYYSKPQCDTLILVRYLMGTAYLPRRLAGVAYHVFERFVPTSEYMFFLDARPEQLVDRVKKRRETEMFETYDAFLKVREKALELAKGWHIVCTDGTVDETFSKISSILDDLDRKK